MKISKSMSRARFAGAVVKQLAKDDISAVLVGGACISIYTNNRHESKDLDFISPSSMDAITASLAKRGFKRKGRYFIHPNSKFYVEFPSGPIALGNESPVKPEGKISIEGTVVKMLSPTQSVMDRLSAFFHWNDRRSFIHALWVCERQPVSVKKLSVWATKEKSPEKFAEFLAAWKRLKKPKKNRRPLRRQGAALGVKRSRTALKSAK